MKEIETLAYDLGFRGCYLLKPAPYPQFAARRRAGKLHPNAAQVSEDPAADYPWANTVILLLTPYRPYAPELGVSGYYPASNRAYHAARALAAALGERGVRAERAAFPVRETLVRAGIGIPCKNGLTAVPPYGTRAVYQSLAAYIPQVAYTPGGPQRTACSSGAACLRCAAACPSGAVSEAGYDYAKCIRADMDGGDMSERTMDAMTSLLGCELCQFACPMNAGVEAETALPDAFRLERLLSGDDADALRLIGRNLKSGGRLLQHALVMAARQNRRDLMPLVEAHLADPRPQIAHAARYAISLLRKAPG